MASYHPSDPSWGPAWCQQLSGSGSGRRAGGCRHRLSWLCPWVSLGSDAQQRPRCSVQSSLPTVTRTAALEAGLPATYRRAPSQVGGSATATAPAGRSVQLVICEESGHPRCRTPRVT